MKRGINLFVVMVLIILAGIWVSPAKAAPVSYTSTFQIINLKSSATTIHVAFLDSTGTEVHSIDTSIAANDSITVTVANESISGSFDGSVVVSANGRIASSSNLEGVGSSGSAMAYASYVAFSTGSSSAYLPLLMKNNYQYNTFVTVQNLGTSATNLTATYSDGHTVTFNGLQPGASHKFDQSTETHSATVFSGVVSSSGSVPIGAVIAEVGPDTLFTYSSFSEGATDVVMPLINENNYGYFTSATIQNLGSVSTQVEVTYTASLAGTGCKEVRTIPAGKSTIFAQHVFTPSKDASTFVSTTCTQGATFVGTGVITANSASVPLAAVVNQLNSAAKKGEAYDAFGSNAGTEKVVFPLIMDRNYDFFTSWSIANLGTAAIPANAISCEVKGKDINGTSVDKILKNPSSIAPGAGWTLNHQGVIANRFVGGAICTGPSGSQMVGTVNELQNSSIDSLLVYEGFNVTP